MTYYCTTTNKSERTNNRYFCDCNETKMKNTSLSYNEALHKAAAYCSLSEHCISEVMSKFSYWGTPQSFQEKIIQFLVREKYIDENRFAEAYAKDKFRYNKWGKIRIRTELKAKKVEDTTIESALATINEKEYREMIVKLAQEKEKGITYRNEYEKKGKLYRYLSGKGFENEYIGKILKINI